MAYKSYKIISVYYRIQIEFNIIDFFLVRPGSVLLTQLIGLTLHCDIIREVIALNIDMCKKFECQLYTIIN